MSEHTPGPWRVIRSKVEKHKRARFIVADGVFVGKVYGHEGQPVDANANLFAVAPDLLAVVRTLAARYAGEFPATDPELREAARAALAKVDA